MTIIKDRTFRRIIEEMVEKYPNDMILGEKIRFYVRFLKEVNLKEAQNRKERKK